MSDHLIPPRIVGAPGWQIYHKKKGRTPPYAYGNTEPALRRAARLKRIGIDLDLTINRDGTPMVNHWRYPLNRDGWTDPAKKMGRFTPIDKMTDEDCARLRYRLNGKSYPMLTARQAAARCKSLGLIPCFEVKADPGRNRVHSVDFWREFKAMCDVVGVVPVMMSLPGSKGVPGRTVLRAVIDAGLVGLWLWRKGYSIPPFVDLVKSHQGRNIYRVSDRPIGDTPPEPTPPRPNPPEAPMPRQARSLDVLLAEVNKAAPNRNKASDGGLGDPRHAAGVSDHNPNSAGVWRARDITNDPGHGCDANRIASDVADLLGKHPALGSGAYVIWNRRIISTDRHREGWRRYTGSNPHDKHVHISVGTRNYDATADWGVLKPKAKPMNNVQLLRREVLTAIGKYRDNIPKDRTAARAWVAALTAVAKRGPKS